MAGIGALGKAGTNRDSWGCETAIFPTRKNFHFFDQHKAMTRPINREAHQKEERIKEAIEGVQSGKYKSVREAGRELNVPHATISHRMKGRKTRVESHEDQQILSEEEEKELSRWIRDLTVFGYPPKPYAVKEMAEAIQTRRVIEINNPSIIHVSYDAIGDQWVGRFLTRHPELQCLIAEQIEATRITDTSRPVLEKWFAAVKSIIDEFNIDPKNIHNMDETGCSIGSIKATRVIIDRTKNIRYSAYPGRQEWVSVIECISMDGTSLPPLIIFKGKTLSSRWIPSNTPRNWFFSCNTEGWTSNEHMKKWLVEDFEPNTRDKANGQMRLLIFDGHGSHTTSDVIRHCILNKIKLALLPPHSSHLTQPLDIGVFSSLKAHLTPQLDRYIRTGIPRIQKVEWTDAFIKARKQAFTVQNILSGWSGTGLFPFYPHKVLRRVPEILLPIQSSPQQPSLEYPTPLHNPTLTSSPIESPAMNAANIHIKRKAENLEATLNSPASRKHVRRMTTALNRSFARNRIQATELAELKRIVSTRKQRQSGKHKILKGETIIATPEMLCQIEEAEAATQKPKRQKVTHSSTPPPENIDPSLYLTDLDSDNDENEILDCIIVAET